jgi:hypothetical protein
MCGEATEWVLETCVLRRFGQKLNTIVKMAFRGLEEGYYGDPLLMRKDHGLSIVLLDREFGPRVMRTCHLRTQPLIIRWARPDVYIMIKLRICYYYLISVFQMCLVTGMMMIEYGYAMKNTDLGVQAHRSPTFGLLAAQQCFIGKAITHPFGVRLRLMSTWWKACLISFQIDLLPPQYHVEKASKS